jgi:hypothetical protein
MTQNSRAKIWRWVTRAAAAAAMTTALTPLSHAQQTRPTPLEGVAFELPGIETANPLPRRALAVTICTAQSLSSQGTGTGNQIYYFGAEYGATHRLSYGVWGEAYEDPVITPINGTQPEVDLDALAAFGSFHVYDGDGLDVALKGSVEFQRLQSTIWGTEGGPNARNVVGSLQMPITYDAAPGLQVHVTPGISLFPETLNGNDFYGVVPFIGAGASYRFNPRILAFGGVTLPIDAGGGNNLTTTSTINSKAIWTVGGRFNVTPKAALDLYATNAIGTTPTSRILTHWPNAEEVVFGARLTWTPGKGRYHRESYQPIRGLSDRQLSVQRNGFTLPSVATFDPGIIDTRVWYGTQDNIGGGVNWSPDQHLQFEGYIEGYADDGSVPAGLLPLNPDQRYMLGGKLRFLDQTLGDPFSFSGRVLGGRDTDTNQAGNGVLYIEAIFGYNVSEALSVTAVGKAAGLRSNEYFGVGLGVNYGLWNGLELIGEVTPTDGGNGTVWAAGLRYSVPESGWAIDAHATNAVGHNGLGSMIAQDSTKFAVSVSKSLDFSRWR